MKPETGKKRSASFSYGLGVAQIVAGIPLTVLAVTFIAIAYNIYHGPSWLEFLRWLYSPLQAVLFSVVCGGAFLIISGARSCALVTRYQKISAAMGYNTREKLDTLANVTKQDLTALVRDLRKMAGKGYIPGAHIDLAYREFSFEKSNRPTPTPDDGEEVLIERERPSFLTLLAFPATFAAYAVITPKDSWTGLVIAGSLSFIAFVLALIKSPRVHAIYEKKYKALPPPPKEPIATGNEALDDLLTTAMGYLDRLNELSLSITDAKMTEPISELLNVSRQIFAFVEKQPEKIRQIRQFMNYYLPTTIELLQSYRDFSREQLKGSNIKEAMTKIEASMSGIVDTFRRELDNLYRDKADDITVEVDVLLAMMRRNDVQEDFPQEKRKDV